MHYKIIYFSIVFYFSLNVKPYAQDTIKVYKYNGIYQTENNGKEFKLKSDSTQVFKADTIGFISIQRFKEVSISFDYDNHPTLAVKLDELGKEKFTRLTENNIGKPFAFIINDKLYTAPMVNAKIPNGTFVISGFGTMAELEKLKRLINAIQLRTSKEKID